MRVLGATRLLEEKKRLTFVLFHPIAYQKEGPKIVATSEIASPARSLQKIEGGLCVFRNAPPEYVAGSEVVTVPSGLPPSQAFR